MRSLVAGLLMGVAAVSAGAQVWTAPTAEELTMTSQAGAPGASAVYLYREMTTDDEMRMFSYYDRLKVLNDGGKEFANVELPFVSDRLGYSIDSIAGRTIHPDGTIIPFTGKPYDKLIEKTQGMKVRAKVFTLPSVEVGSIIEYRYKLRYDDSYFSSPDWYIQSNLYTRRAHYAWRPTTRLLQSDSEGAVSSIAWTPFLPKGATVKQTDLPGKPGKEISLDVQEIPALPRERYMAPASSLSYRVLFYWTSYASTADYWQHAGKRWMKGQERFIGPNKGVREFVAKTVSPGDAPEVKLKKLYDAVMAMENTDFTRQRTTSEEKAEGLREVTTTDDVLARKRGNGDQLSGLFVAMARAAGFKAYPMGVANLEKRIFIQAYMSLAQLDDDIAIVTVDGKDRFFDPGQRFCEFGHLAWMHANGGGLRETDGGGTQVTAAPPENYKTARVQRIADLTLDEHGEATGTVKMSYTGDPALEWRQEALRGDDTSLNADLRQSMERLLPGGMEVRVTNVANLLDPEKPLQVDYAVKGAIGTPTGKRLLIPGNLFEVNAKPSFPEAKREQMVLMHYPSYYQDAVRIKYPATMAVESSPAAATEKFQNVVLFNTYAKPGQGSVTTFRNVQLATSFFDVKEYPELRAFYGRMENKDQESLVLIRAGGSQVAAGSSGAGTASTEGSKP